MSALKPPFAAVEQPIDGALLIDLQVVGVEVVQEVIANDVLWLAAVAEGVGDEVQVLVQRFLAVDHLDEAHKPGDDIVVEVFVVADGDHIVHIDGEALIPFLIHPTVAGTIGFRSVRVDGGKLLKLRIVAIVGFCCILDAVISCEN